MNELSLRYGAHLRQILILVNHETHCNISGRDFRQRARDGDTKHEEPYGGGAGADDIVEEEELLEVLVLEREADGQAERERVQKGLSEGQLPTVTKCES